MAAHRPTAKRQRQQWVDHANEELSQAGYRSSAARMRVIELLGDQDCCLSAQQIFDELRDRTAIGIASIYRAVDLLQQKDLVHRLDLSGVAYYEPALPSGEHHHHVVCDRCGNVASFEDGELEKALTRLAKRLRYSVRGHDVVLRGTCPACRRG